MGEQSLMEWAWEDLTQFKQMEQIHNDEGLKIFACRRWTWWVANNWWMVWVALSLYVPMVFLGQKVMKTREKIYNKTIIFCWNFLLASFSILGFCSCMPQLLFSPVAGVLSVGIKEAVCTQASWYGNGWPGFWVCAFILSKLAELIDTLWLVLGKKPVIFLHWYHHVTVLLFCWHSYSKATGVGIWFATINYGVHSIMYTYYSFTSWSPAGKEFVKPIAPHIMKVQIIQMVAGVLVILGNIYYSMKDPLCDHSTMNNVAGLLMYISYFYLFGELYVNRFLVKKERTSAQKKRA